MQEKITNKQLRSFGLMVGGMFGLIALWPVLVHSSAPRWWALIAALCFVVPGLLFPGSLFWIHKAWMAFGHTMGWINTRILLGIVFYAVVTPLGAVRAWLGKDPMGRRLQPEAESYRVPRKPRPALHLKRQF
ncbi:MAG TPA: SxtJ family membrane protein [Verrucomicrobiae bacterium]|nr:SxtJ family membrane protein [Verrucomicrobiae bacterium]